MSILSQDSNYIADVVMWPKFCNSSNYYERSYHNLDFRTIWPEKTLFSTDSMVDGQWFGTDTWYGLEILHRCGRSVKTKSKKVLGANSYVFRSTRGKTDKGPGWVLLR